MGVDRHPYREVISASILTAESVAHCGWIFYLPRDDTEIRAFGGMIEWRELDAIRVNVENFILSGGEPREIL